MDCDTLETAAARLGADLAKARRSRKLSQRSLAARVGMSRMTVANLEAGRGTVAALVTVLDALAHRFIEQPADLELGPWIAHSRKRLGLSQERLSIQSGVSRPALIRIERGEGTITTLVAVMSALGLSIALIGVAIEKVAAPLPAPTVRLHHGDCREQMRGFTEKKVLFDSIVTDPPYHLALISRRFGRKPAAPLKGGEAGNDNPYRSMATGFMQQTWDGGDIAFDTETWRAAYAVLKPGGHLIAFGGPRTFHRLAVAIEDAGFEIRDTIMWVFGSGFPKSHHVGRAIEGMKQGSARFSGRTMDADSEVSRPGALLEEMASGNWSGRRVRIQDEEALRWEGHGTALKPAFEPILIARKPISESSVAANVLRYGTGALNIDACRIKTPDSTGRPGSRGVASFTNANVAAGIPPKTSLKQSLEAPRLENGRWPANFIHDGSPSVVAGFPVRGKSRGGGGLKITGRSTYGSFGGAMYDGDVGYGDAGSSARFFYTAKASKADRGPGNNHPTVKPNDLMRYLVRLVTPPSGTVFDPFMGSGSTGIAALQEGFSFAGCEQQAEYIEIARRRIAKVMPKHGSVLSDLQSEEKPACRSAS